ISRSIIVGLMLIIACLTSRPLLAAETFHIRHARVFDGSAVIDDAEVIIRDGVIQQVGKNLTAADAEVIDATGKTLLPGLIDCHVHIVAPPSFARPPRSASRRNSTCSW